MRFCGADGTVGTMTVTDVECDKEPLVPVMVIAFTYVPGAAAAPTVRIVDESDDPDVVICTEGALRLAVMPVTELVATSETVPVNPLSDPTVIFVELSEDPALIDKEEVDADIEKSGDATPLYTSRSGDGSPLKPPLPLLRDVSQVLVCATAEPINLLFTSEGEGRLVG